jgi:hypothetical protein
MRPWVVGINIKKKARYEGGPRICVWKWIGLSLTRLLSLFNLGAT